MPKILVIDDDRIMQRMIFAFLTKNGYEVKLVSSAVDGLAILNTEEVYDAITCDFYMPEMNGVQFLEQIKRNEKLQNIPVIIISAAGLQEDQERVMKAGAASLLTKPFTPTQICQVLHDVLSGEAT
jgi:CheY-like chemotaxis protein